MRTTLTIDDDVPAAARERASTEQETIGEVISALARQALRPSPQNKKIRSGVPLLKVRPDTARVTSEFVKQIEEELRLSRYPST